MSASHSGNSIANGVHQSQELCRRFSLAEIQSATDNFDDALVIGKGGFGKVYKGLIDDGATTVAIKRLNAESKQGAVEFWAEIKTLSKLRHAHLVSLIGYSDDSEEMILVYEYMANLTLADHLYKISRPVDCDDAYYRLTWEQRLTICLGAARGLDFLHSNTVQSVIHRDVKTTNILLDENWVAKISDFGLSKMKMASQTQSYFSTDVKGTFGYLDPEYYLTRRLTKKSDVYAFGVVLLEVLCARPPVDMEVEEEQRSLSQWAQRCIKKRTVNQIVDPSLKGKIQSHSLKVFVDVANRCLQTLPKGRPTMAEVVGSLELMLSSRGNTTQRMVNFTTVFINVSQYLRPKGGIDLRRATRKLQSSKTEQSWRLDGVIKSFRCFSPAEIRAATNNRGTSNAPVAKSSSASPSRFSAKATKASNDTCSKGEILSTPDLKDFSFADLKSATQNFRPDAVLGEGGFGTVFKGWVDEKTLAPSFKYGSGMIVAIKKLNYESMQGLDEWQAEVNILGRLSHPNLIKLLGYCSEVKELLLVYEYLQKGTLESHLFRRINSYIPLSWDIRLKIAIGAARGLAFLHTAEKEVIYRDLKSSNILLDGNYNAKLTDFGLAKSGPSGGNSHVSTRVMGTYGYAAPEYVATGHLYLKSDVYSFGVVLLEMLTGLPAIDCHRPSRQHNLVDWAKPLLSHERKLNKILDARIEGQYSSKAAFLVAQLTLRCLASEPKKRPSMIEVVGVLEQIESMTPLLLSFI